MRIVTDSRETREGLRALRRELTRQLGKPRSRLWGFPGEGGRDEVPTWHHDEAAGPLAVAIGGEGSWETRTPVLLARSPLAPVMTPTVEINVPVGDGATNRMVNGCLCVERRSQFVLAHRGGSFTVTPWKVPREAVLRHFAKWLQVVTDADRQTPVIPVGPVGPQLVAHMASFADAVAALKNTWATNRGNAAKVSRHLGWHEELNFPKKIQRALSASVKTFDYRHGPMQSGLRKALMPLLPPCCRVVLNSHIDLGILHDKQLLAIFEVKTGLGPQVFSGVGQLFCYRQQFAQAKTPLFLVVPGDADAAAEISQVGNLLRGLGVELVLTDEKAFASWDGRRLGKLLAAVRRHGKAA